jgi:hypothetical protein
VTMSADLTEIATRCGGRLRPRDGRGGRRGRRLFNTGEDEGDIDALHAGSLCRARFAMICQRSPIKARWVGGFSDREIADFFVAKNESRSAA